jgi:hypothetical protein
LQEVKSWQCSQCGKVLCDLYGLKRHEAAVHFKLRPFPCQRCTKTFATRGDLNAHQTTVHQNVK